MISLPPTDSNNNTPATDQSPTAEQPVVETPGATGDTSNNWTPPASTPAEPTGSVTDDPSAPMAPTSETPTDGSVTPDATPDATVPEPQPQG